MGVRVLVAVLVALLVGAGAGWAVAAAQDDEPAPTAPVAGEVAPVPASPSLPVAQVMPDPDDDPLATGLELVPTTLTATVDDDEPAPALDLYLPDGWAEDHDGVATWRYTVPENSINAYQLRVEIVTDQGETVSGALRRRTAELGSAEAQGNLSDVRIEIDPTGDGFSASFIDLGGYRRFSFERFYPGPDGLAFATVAVSGREEDRPGMKDLIDRITRDLRPVQKP